MGNHSGNPAPADGKLDEILQALAKIQNDINALRRSQYATELNLRALQQAHHQSQAQVTAVETRCAQRGELIREFLEQLECSGPPHRRMARRAQREAKAPDEEPQPLPTDEKGLSPPRPH